MFRVLFLISILSFPISLFSQNDNTNFLFNGFDYRIISQIDTNSTNYFLTITKNKIEVNKIKLNFASNSFEPPVFGNYINKSRKFIIIQSKYSFFILNLYNNKLSKLYQPHFYRMAQDAQSAMLSDLSIILNGRAIIGYCVDSGVFLFDFTNLYNGLELKPTNNPLFSKNRVFLMKDFENQNKSIAVFVFLENWEVDYKILFKNKTIEWYKYNKKSNKQKYFNKIEGKFTILKEILTAKNFKFIVIDNSNGKFVDIPYKIENSTIQNVKNYLKDK